MFDIGASLSAAREARGLTLAEAEALTCIRAKHLAALENEAWDSLPGRTYARAFLRSYAGALGLDADRFVVAFEERVPEEVEELPAARPRRSLPGIRPALTFGAVLAVIVIVAWGSTMQKSPPVVVPPVHSAAGSQPVHEASGALGVQHTVVAPRPALVIRATRGDCWLLVRRGGPTGHVLYENTLRRGGVVRFTARLLWVRLGAPGMVDVRRGSRVVPGLVGLAPTNIVA